jgi:hypothetical protein
LFLKVSLPSCHQGWMLTVTFLSVKNSILYNSGPLCSACHVHCGMPGDL